MDEEKRETWLEEQNMTIPIQAFVEMRLYIKDLETKTSAEWDKRWKVEQQLEKANETIKELRKNLDAAKIQIKELLDIKEVKPDADDGR